MFEKIFYLCAVVEIPIAQLGGVNRLPAELLLIKELLGQVEVVDDCDAHGAEGEGGQGVARDLGVQHPVCHTCRQYS